jgi:adenylate cyclase
MGSKSLCFRFEKKSAQAVCMNLRRLSILFADIRSFTAIAEDLPMKDMVSQLDEFFKAMGDIIGEHGGTVLRYMGDAILAIFGAPVEYEDHAKRAVLASIEMHMKIGALNEVWIARGQPLFRMGIGINTGEVMAGDMGSRHLREYSIVGDDANLAARLEELTKELDARIIISGSTKDEIGDAAVAVPLGTVTVEGRKKPTEIYRVDW